jgi:endonuclease/exonuclease/phosphatase family metal-dependent hydrolase
MRELGADLILAQEVSTSAMPNWSDEGWDLVAGEMGRIRKDWKWGSVIAARRELNLVPYEEALAHPWLAQLYDLVLVGRIQVKQEPIVVASVHSAAVEVRHWIRDYATTLNLTEREYESLRRPNSKERPFLNDMAFIALDSLFGKGRFIVGGDWNTCRQFKGGPEFFGRAKAYGWVECHQEPEEQSYFGRGTYQLDHAFVDTLTAAAGIECHVRASDIARSLSDHAPMVVDIVGVDV